jgi:hypothetical protein
MVRLSWKVYTALILLGLSALMGVGHVLLFKDTQTLLFYLALDIVFVPVQVLLVTLIIERLLNEREKQVMMKKLNMVIGAFMSEVGADFLRRVDSFCGEAPELALNLAVNDSWGNGDYKAAERFAERYQARLDPDAGQLLDLRDFLLSRRPFVLSLLQNPNLLEHDRFTDLLWAICHLTEELEARDDFSRLPQTDRQHLCGDIQRANGMLIRQWLNYMRHLQEDYPYIYSLAIRMNPFTPDASPVVYG